MFLKQNSVFLHYKKPLYNFYWGKPQIINIDSDLYNTHKIMPKYDYVPNEKLILNGDTIDNKDIFKNALTFEKVNDEINNSFSVF